jgi:hypothetical protein
MFFEIDPDLLKQVDQPLIKRWYRDSGAECDLLVWGDEKNEIKRFQFWHQDALLEWNSASGIKTGHVDKASGSFTHYQSDLYRMHHNLDTEILNFVSNLVQNHASSQEDLINKIFLILNDIRLHS